MSSLASAGGIVGSRRTEIGTGAESERDELHPVVLFAANDCRPKTRTDGQSALQPRGIRDHRRNDRQAPPTICRCSLCSFDTGPGGREDTKYGFARQSTGPHTNQNSCMVSNPSFAASQLPSFVGPKTTKQRQYGSASRRKDGAPVASPLSRPQGFLLPTNENAVMRQGKVLTLVLVRMGSEGEKRGTEGRGRLVFLRVREHCSNICGTPSLYGPCYTRLLLLWWWWWW